MFRRPISEEELRWERFKFLRLFCVFLLLFIAIFPVLLGLAAYQVFLSQGFSPLGAKVGAVLCPLGGLLIFIVSEFVDSKPLHEHESDGDKSDEV